jgi:hypothetical protein
VYGRINFNIKYSYQVWLRRLVQLSQATWWEIRFKSHFLSGLAVFEREANQLEGTEWQEVKEHIERMLDTLKYGSITLVVQDGKIVQIEKNEKVRLQSNKIR